MPKYDWHICHHCDGAGCEVCEEAGGWFETAEERRVRQERDGFTRARVASARARYGPDSQQVRCAELALHCHEAAGAADSDPGSTT